MPCLDIMYNQNSQKKGLCAPPMSPRLSFSTDFAESSHNSLDHQMMIKHEKASREAPVSSDFEFSVTDYSMIMSADELFSKGRLLPFKDSCNNQYQKTTLRDELLVDDDDDDDDISMRRPKGWKELLGLKKPHIGSKKSAKNDGHVERRPGLVHEETHVSKTSQEMLNEGGSSCRDVEFGM